MALAGRRIFSCLPQQALKRRYGRIKLAHSCPDDIGRLTRIVGGTERPQSALYVSQAQAGCLRSAHWSRSERFTNYALSLSDRAGSQIFPVFVQVVVVLHRKVENVSRRFEGLAELGEQAESRR